MAIGRVDPTAVANFLASLDGLSASSAFANLRADTKSYGWNAATNAAIARGISKHFARLSSKASIVPVIGSRWGVRVLSGQNVWKVVAQDGGEFVLECESAVEMPGSHKTGDRITVERMWFTFRSGLAANAPGAVRRVA